MTEPDDSLAERVPQVGSMPGDPYIAFAQHLARLHFPPYMIGSRTRRLTERLTVAMTPDGEHHLRLNAPLDAAGLPELMDSQHLLRARPDQDEA